MTDRTAPSSWQPRPARAVAAVAVALAAGLSGCSSDGGAPSPAALSLPAVKMPALTVPSVSMPDVKMPKIEMPKMVGPVVGSPTDVYTRVARGALLCWFGGNGPLKGKYLYHAEADPPSRGGKADIAIHAIDPSAQNPRAGRVYHITIEAEGERAKMTAENLRLPDDLARRLWYDAHRWAGTTDDVECAEDATAEGWNAGPAPATAAVAVSKGGAKKPKQPAAAASAKAM